MQHSRLQTLPTSGGGAEECTSLVLKVSPETQPVLCHSQTDFLQVLREVGSNLTEEADWNENGATIRAWQIGVSAVLVVKATVLIGSRH